MTKYKTEGAKSGGNLAVLYKIHDYLTDRKILKTITTEEERQLQEVRSALESNEQGLTAFYENKIAGYQKILEEIKNIEAELTPR